MDSSITESTVRRFSSGRGAPLVGEVYLQPGFDGRDGAGSLFPHSGPGFGTQRNGAYAACSAPDPVFGRRDAVAGRSPSEFIRLVGDRACAACAYGHDTVREFIHGRHLLCAFGLSTPLEMGFCEFSGSGKPGDYWIADLALEGLAVVAQFTSAQRGTA